MYREYRHGSGGRGGRPGRSLVLRPQNLAFFGPCLITGRNEVLAKVIFLHLFVILFTGGWVGIPACLAGQSQGGGYPSMPCRSVPGGSGPRGSPIFQGVGVWVSNFLGGSTIGGALRGVKGDSPPFFDFCFLWGYPLPPGTRHRNMVNVWPVRILLECILVFLYFLFCLFFLPCFAQHKISVIIYYFSK